MASDPTAPAGEADRAIDSVSALGEDSRRRMSVFVRRAGRAVTRDEAAAGVGNSRKLAAFHPHKLVDAGLSDLLLEAVPAEGADESAAQAPLRSAEHRGGHLREAAPETTRPGRLGPDGTDHYDDHDDADHDDAMAQDR
ncbi:hypothetical protein ABZX39_25115 [Streptomyces collinus]|uniref:hypothetical protein n=1 Tax=Streptomyces collinus TaxID=42684 RepID=UPI0033BD370D